jgi:uncharacterized membrane protein HdeD (DUF308 family)
MVCLRLSFPTLPGIPPGLITAGVLTILFAAQVFFNPVLGAVTIDLDGNGLYIHRYF